MTIDSWNSSEVIDHFSLTPLDREGGYFAPVHGDAFGNSIYFLMTVTQFSGWHRLSEPETWTLLAGADIALYVKADTYQQVSLSRREGRLSHTVEASEWMAAETLGEWSLILCTLAPPFSGMELATLDDVTTWQLRDPSIRRLIHE